jgi:phosphate starvation-inducible PhoH-like protein
MSRAIEEFDIVIAHGVAGSGKTLVSIFKGLEFLSRRKAKKMIITKPLVTVGEQLGFLPGDVDEKTAPFMENMEEFLMESPEYQRIDEIVESVPLALMRGRTFNDRFIIADEMQNSTQHQMEMLMTRLGKNSKLVITGDNSQSDLGIPNANGLSHAIRLFGNHKKIKIIKFGYEDICRHGLVADIIRAYAKDREEQWKLSQPPSVTQDQSVI